MAADIGVKISADGAKEFQASLKDIVAQSKLLDSEMKLVASSFDKNTSAEKKAAAENKVLTKQIENQKQKIALLKNEITKASAKYGENDSRVVKLKTDLNKAETALNTMTSKVKENGNAFTRFGDKLKGAFTGLKDGERHALSFGDVLKANVIGGVITSGIKALANGVKEVATGIRDAATAAAQFADDVNTIAAKTGLTTDQVQELKYMSELTDTSLETITGSMSKLTKNMAGAQDGTGAAAEAFQKLGVSITDSNGDLRSNQAVFSEIISALGQVENETERDALAMSIFGKSAQDLNPLIKTGGDQLAAYAQEAHDMGYVLDGEALTGLNDVSDGMARLQNLGTALKNNITSMLAPAISGLINNFLALSSSIDWTAIQEGGLPVLMEQLSGMAETIAAKIPEVVTAMVSGFTEALPQIMETAGVILGGLVQGLIAAAPMLIDGAAAAITSLANGMTGNMDQLISTAGQLIMAIGGAIIRNLPQIIASGVQLIGALVQGLLNSIPKIVAAIPSIVASIRNSFSSIDWASIGRNIIQGIGNGLRNAASAIVEAAKDAARRALEAAKSFLGINSPSKVFEMEVGRNMALGMGEGFAKYTPTKQIAAATKSATAAASSTSVSYGGTTVNVYAQPGQSVKAIADAVAQVINRQVDQRVNAWATA